MLVVPGGYFFFGLEKPWNHDHECIRVTFSQTAETVSEGIAIIGDEIARAYAHGG